MNNTVENIQEEKLTYSELRSIADRLYDRLSQLLDEYYIRTKVEFDTIRIEIGTKFFEISEFVSSMVENELNENEEFGNLSEEEIEEYYKERYSDLLEEINGENTVYVNGKINTQKYTITFEPLECKNDYCIAGLYIELKPKDKISNIDIENIANLIADTFHL